jgi:hypothetical protein
VNRRLPPWFLLVLLCAVCAGVIGVVWTLRSWRLSADELMKRLPADNAVLLYIDFAALRRAGVLQLFEGSEVIQEPEYRAFKVGTGLDYQRDLNSALVSLSPQGHYLIVRGRFDWSRLGEWVTEQGGTCYNSSCRVRGSAPDRNVSFFPLQPDLMALAVSKDTFGADLLLTRKSGGRPASFPGQPVWAFVSAGALRQADKLPPSARMFAQALEASDGILLAAEPRGVRWELRLEVACRSAQDAATLAAHLEKVTLLLREAILREGKQPDPRDLSGVLTAGVFERKERLVYGRWPLERVFLESLARGTP